MTIIRKEVESSNIKAVAYDELMNNLQIEFHNGTVYEYAAGPFEVFKESTTDCTSVGKYFQANVRNKYDFLRIR